MNYPKLSEELLLHRLEWRPGMIRMVLDTDTFNEIDDQFAVAYALLSPERLKVEALYAAPFQSPERSIGPGEGMEASYAEILRLLERLGSTAEGLAWRGATDWLTGREAPEQTPAALDLVKRAMSSPKEDPLYVVAIGAITNVASAIRIEPEIIRRMVVVWLGGQPHHFRSAAEYNLMQDPTASQTLFECGVPLIYIPCYGVASHLLTTVPELEGALKGRNAISDFLFERFSAYETDHFAWAKEIWDIAAIGYLLNENWVPTQVIPCPVLNDDLTWGAPPTRRHLIRTAWYVRRNPIFRDLFLKLQNFH